MSYLSKNGIDGTSSLDSKCLSPIETKLKGHKFLKDLPLTHVACLAFNALPSSKLLTEARSIFQVTIYVHFLDAEALLHLRHEIRHE
jgi:hypothetical protein